MCKGLALVLVLVFPLMVGSEDFSTPRARAEQFFYLIGNGKTSEAYTFLFAGSSAPKDKAADFQRLRTQTESALSLYQPLLGHELIHEERFGSAIVRLVYVLKSEQHPMTWELFFYRPKDRWLISSVTFGDKFQQLGLRQ
jgi:hypothetical protein